MTNRTRRTLYHRLLGWHAPSLRRVVVVMLVGLGVGCALAVVLPWQLAAIAGWDVTMMAYLAAVWPEVLRADGERTAHMAGREDPTHGSAAALLVGASVASLLGVGFALELAGRERGADRAVLIGVVVLTVGLSWVTMNTVYTLRYAHLDHRSGVGRIEFGDPQARVSYRDYAYLAFTIGMTYQVSDTSVRNARIRRTVLGHAMLSYLFGVVIVAGTVSLIAALVA